MTGRGQRSFVGRPPIPYRRHPQKGTSPTIRDPALAVSARGPTFIRLVNRQRLSKRLRHTI